VEQYRKVAATLHHAHLEQGTRIVMIASAMAAEGKTITAANLAITLSASYLRSVCLMDGDLRRPSLHSLFNVPNVSGLNEALGGKNGYRLTATQLTPRLAFVGAGRPNPDPAGLLTSEPMRLVLEQAAKTFDWVLIDTPPVCLMSDANLLAGLVDGVILVVDAGRTPYTLAQRAVEALGRDRIIGVVLNRASHGDVARGYGYAGYDRYTLQPAPDDGTSEG
jgi:capsular exopolysaccharide synthesis family protein